ncbi:rod shape-determining protein MreD [Trichlorobacter lovleyi]|uniref:rod shape-determining protein MreD n=1 Tax=Trichlorobacter lovleyi TaxID=313985 RepID=UPI00223F0E73|nr:rod shape-determining protein MreD [Trichlorobacter lovleyi]QOX79475.1 rod shape-determining protein MreD [Trichlorobacter lovleyi]
MTGFLKGTALVLGIVLLQTSVLPQYLIALYKPDLLLILMVFLALRAPVSTSLPAAYGLGLLKDCLSGLYLGLNAFSFLLVYLVLKTLSDRLYVQNALLLVLTVSLSTFATMLVNALLLSIFSEAAGIFSSLMTALIPHLLINAFVASLVAILPEFGSPRTAK